MEGSLGLSMKGWAATAVVGGLMALTTSVASAQMGGVPAFGRDIAQRWCAACHVVEPGQRDASSDVPSFADIAARRTDLDALAAFLADPHPVMPDMSLTREEIRNLVAYIGSLH